MARDDAPEHEKRAADDASTAQPRSALGPRRGRSPAEKTPLTRSGVVARGRPPSGFSKVADRAGALSGRRKRGDSEPPSLTPYQARLDVEMDDTAVSKVRDPSASISLGPEGNLIDLSKQQAGARPASPRSALSLSSVALGGGFGILVVALAVVGTRWLEVDTVEALPTEAPPARASASAPAPLAPAPLAPAPAPAVSGPMACVVARPPRRVAGATDSVAPLVELSADAAAATLGYAKIPGQAMGLRIVPRKLDTDVVFRQWKREVVSRVVPTRGADGAQRFAVHRGVYRSWEETTLPGLPDVRVRASASGVVTLRDGGKPETLWPLAAERVADVRAVASESRHLVMVRTEAPPAVYAGWLDERGHSASPLQVVTAGLDAVRDAAVAVRGDEALVVVSAGEPGAERLLASRWSARQAPPPLVALEGEAPSGARGGLAATALPSGWWIQWTARDAAGVRLTGAALASSLQLGPAVEISPPLAALSPVGAVAIGGDVVSVYAVPDGAGRSDVWAAAAACN